jgi:hypothetical protein
VLRSIYLSHPTTQARGTRPGKDQNIPFSSNLYIQPHHTPPTVEALSTPPHALFMQAKDQNSDDSHPLDWTITSPSRINTSPPRFSEPELGNPMMRDGEIRTVLRETIPFPPPHCMHASRHGSWGRQPACCKHGAELTLHSSRSTVSLNVKKDACVMRLL